MKGMARFSSQLEAIRCFKYSICCGPPPRCTSQEFECAPMPFLRLRRVVDVVNLIKMDERRRNAVRIVETEARLEEGIGGGGWGI